MAPSVKTLKTAFPKLTDGDITQIRWTIHLAEEAGFYDRPKLAWQAMRAIDRILGTYGVESIPRGRNSKSPAIIYCNTGETYGTTILCTGGTYHFWVGSWGDVVERGNYE